MTHTRAFPAQLDTELQFDMPCSSLCAMINCDKGLRVSDKGLRVSDMTVLLMSP
mgnify:CR=1 FL=1